jgi:hypothetical protein
MQEVFFLSSMDSKRFSSVFRCEVERPIELPNGHHALMVSCDPPLNGQELGHPLGVGELLLWSRFEDEDLWTFPAFPHFVQICLPDVDLPVHATPPSIAWGEIYKTEADAHAHEMSARPRSSTKRSIWSASSGRLANRPTRQQEAIPESETVTVRPPLTTMSDAFDRTHGPAQPGRPATRLEEFGRGQQTTNGTIAAPPAW